MLIRAIAFEEKVRMDGLKRNDLKRKTKGNLNIEMKFRFIVMGQIGSWQCHSGSEKRNRRRVRKAQWLCFQLKTLFQAK